MPTFSRILAPIAFSAQCQGSLEYSEALACHFKSELVLLHVVPPVQNYGFPDAMAVAPELMQDVLAQSKTALENFAAENVKDLPAKARRRRGRSRTGNRPLCQRSGLRFDCLAHPRIRPFSPVPARVGYR